MDTNNSENYIPALIADYFSLASGGMPISSFGQVLANKYSEWVNQKKKISIDIWLEEVSAGNQLETLADPEQLFSLLFRYLNAVKLGAAKKNLRLMARTIRNGLQNDCPFTPDKIAAKAELIATLSRDEIQLLATYISCKVETGDSNELDDLESDLDHAAIQNQVIRKLVPSIFVSQDQFKSCAGALCRTGLLVSTAVWDGTRYDMTESLFELEQLCNLSTLDEKIMV